MIRIYTITAPLSDEDPTAAVATVQNSADKLRRLYPPLITAQAVADQGVLTLTLRVSARDQWACSKAARKIGTNLLVRLKIPPEHGTLELAGTAPPATTLTAERGRNVSGHRPRGPQYLRAPDAA